MSFDDIEFRTGMVPSSASWRSEESEKL